MVMDDETESSKPYMASVALFPVIELYCSLALLPRVLLQL